MNLHFELTSKFSSHVDNGSFDKSNSADRVQLVEIMMHAVDLSNVCRPYELSKRWADVLFEEMLQQGDIEKSKGLSVSQCISIEIPSHIFDIRYA